MKKNSKVAFFCLLILIFFVSGSYAYAHGGRTDGSGGHRDNRNVSGLGYYHYHHGRGPHLHPGGVCPYSSNTGSVIVPVTETKNITLIGAPNEIKVGENNLINWSTTNSLDKYQVKWSSSDSTIASIDDSGMIKAYKKGRVKITGKLDNVVKSFSLLVTEIGVSEVTIPNKISKLAIGEYYTLKYSINPENASNKGVEWKSSNPPVATIYSSGLITPKSIGTTTISITASNGVTDSFDVEIYEIKPTEISTNYDRIEIETGDKIKLEVDIVPSDSTYKKVEWNVSEEGYYEVDDGEIMALNPGVSSLVLTVGDIKKEIPIEVYFIPVERIEIDYESIPYKFNNYINKGSVFTPNVKVFPENATNDSIQITSNDEKSKVISNRIEITGKGQGEVIIKAGEVEEVINFNSIDFKNVGNGSFIVFSALTVGGSGLYMRRKERKNVNNN